MKMWVKAGLVCALILAVLGGSALAAGTEAAAPIKPKKKLRLRVIDNKAFKMEKDTVVIKGLIEVVQDDTKITATEITYDSKKQFAVLSGGARLEQDDLVLTGDKFSAWFSDDKFQIEGNVRLIKKDQPQGAGDATAKATPAKSAVDKGAADKGTPDKITLTAATMEYNTDKKTLLAKGPEVTVQEKDRRAVAKEVQYDDKTQRLVLVGDVVVTEKDDKTLKGQRVLIDVDKDNVEVEGPSEVEFVLTEEEKPAPPKESQAPATAPTAAPAATPATSPATAPAATPAQAGEQK